MARKKAPSASETVDGMADDKAAAAVEEAVNLSSEADGEGTSKSDDALADDALPDKPQSPRSGVSRAILMAGLGVLVTLAVVFGAVRYLGVDRLFLGDATQRETIADNAAQIALLENSLASLQLIQSEHASDADAAQGRLEATLNSLATSEQTIDDLNRRLTDLENRPGAQSEASDAAVSAYERELAAMRAMFAKELAVIQSAQQKARALALRTSFAQVQLALDSGAPFAVALVELRAGDVSIGVALSRPATTGVPTLAELQAMFPDAARLALKSAISDAVDANRTGRFAAFARNQLGTRSLRPRDGADPDAVLSRAEDALRRGDLDATFAELSGLSEVATAAMTDWSAQLDIRRSALEAAAILAQSLGE